MLIYNSKEYVPQYLREDTGRVIEIRSVYSEEELFTRLKAGEDITENMMNLTAYGTEPNDSIALPKRPEVSDAQSLDEDQLETITRENVEDRPKLFSAYEAFQFNNQWENTNFQSYVPTREEVLSELADALGIMPGLKDIPDISVTELEKMSSMGDRLFRPYAAVTNITNRLPSREEIEFYMGLNDYEQRVINEATINPRRILEAAMHLKDTNKNAVLTKDLGDMLTADPGLSGETAAVSNSVPGNIRLSTIKAARIQYATGIPYNETEQSINALINDLYSRNDTDIPTGFIVGFLRAVNIPQDDLSHLHDSGFLTRYIRETVSPEWEKFKESHKEGYREEDYAAFAEQENKNYIPVHPQVKACEEVFKSDRFKSKHHGHAPRILDYYMEGYCLVNNKTMSSLTQQDFEDIAENFDLKNVQKIAGMRNTVLFAFAPYIRYAEISEKHLQMFASEIKKEDLHKFKEKGFFEWYALHKDTKPSELSELLSNITDRRQYDREDVLDGNTIGELSRFDKDRTAKELINDLLLRRAKRDCEQYEQAYHYKFADNELAIRGRNIVAKDGSLRMYMLPADDYRNFTVGYDTHCCQHWGDAGASCVWKYTTDPFAGVVVIERDGKVLAQAFVWTDEAKDTFVFDNMEFANDARINNYGDIITGYVKALPYKNVHMGVGYLEGGLSSWGRRITFAADIPTTLCGRPEYRDGWGGSNNAGIYTDYHFNGGEHHFARAFKKDGDLLIKERGHVHVETRPDEPTRWDTLMHPALRFLLNMPSMSIEERLDLGRRFLEDQTPEIQMKVVKANPHAVRYIENPTREVQMYVVEQDAKCADLINNPCPDVQRILVTQDPAYIKHINNPSEEMQIWAVQTNGLLLADIKDPSDRVIEEALRQNAYAINSVPEERRTENMMVIAVEKDPRIIGLLKNPGDTVITAALKKDPHTISLLSPDHAGWQTYAVSIDPAVISDIKNPIRPAVEKAIQGNGLLIRNFQYKYPEFRIEAVKQNGFALRALKNPTLEECIEAVKQNERVLSIVPANFKDEVMNSLEDSLMEEADRDI